VGRARRTTGFPRVPISFRFALSSHPALRLAVDIGGTFTDTVIAAPDNRVLATAKTLTSHKSPVRAA